MIRAILSHPSIEGGYTLRLFESVKSLVAAAAITKRSIDDVRFFQGGFIYRSGASWHDADGVLHQQAHAAIETETRPRPGCLLKLTLRQRRYLDACSRADWALFNKTGTPEIRRWARGHALIRRPLSAGSRFQLTEAGMDALAANSPTNDDAPKSPRRSS